jgi:hypothetical protein
VVNKVFAYFGAFIYASKAKVTATDVSVEETYCSEGGALYAIGSASFVFNTSSFKTCQSLVGSILVAIEGRNNMNSFIGVTIENCRRETTSNWLKDIHTSPSEWWNTVWKSKWCSYIRAYAHVLMS